MGGKGPTRTQLQKKANRLELEVKTLRKQLAYYQAGDTVRREGEHWYELVEHFDAHEIQRLPMKNGRAFIMGRLSGMNVVEVSADTTDEDMGKFALWLEDNGIKDALIVRAGVRFLKIRTVDAETEAKLDASQEKNDDSEDSVPARA